MTSLSKFARAALVYAERLGFAVFPLAPRDKIPLIPKWCGGNGFHDATRDLDQIRAWWRSCPDANIGIATGEASGGVFVVDVDPRNEGDIDWAVLRAGKTVPDTVEACTGGGGQHILFRGAVSCSKLGRGVDIKGDGGYIVAPPSVHPDTGLRYLWEASSRPFEASIADAPAWLLALLGTKRPKRDHYTHENSVDPESFALGAAFKAANMLGRELRPGAFAVLCPTRNLHTSGSDYDSSTVIFAPKPGDLRGRFFCAHSHCSEVYR